MVQAQALAEKVPNFDQNFLTTDRKVTDTFACVQPPPPSRTKQITPPNDDTNEDEGKDNDEEKQAGQ